MKLYTFEADGQSRIGAEQDGQLVDLSAANAALPSDMLAFVKMGAAGLEAAGEALALASKESAGAAGRKLTYDLEAVRIRAPLPRPNKILCAGVNYNGHFEENPGAQLPKSPFFFSKLPSGVIDPGQAIVHPKLTGQLDYEVEFAVVIGRSMKDTPEAEVMEHIFGYTILHDVSARDVQFKDSQITLGKNFDTFAPMGPCIVTADEMPDLSDVGLRAYLNGEVMQDSSTQDWIYPLPELLGFLSQVMTLEPGDLVSTGTPAGVGVFRQPPVFLKPGDVVRLEIDGIGQLENPVVAG